MEQFWLSPEGKVFYCTSHLEKANEIISSSYQYSVNDQDPYDALLRRGRMLYRNNQDMRQNGFVVWSHFRGPTQAQRDTIFDLTGKNYNENMNT